MNHENIAELKLLREELRDRLSAITKTQLELSTWMAAGEESLKLVEVVKTWLAEGRRLSALRNEILDNIRNDLHRVHTALRRLDSDEREPWQGE